MKVKALQLGKAMSAALFVLLLSVLGMRKLYAQNINNSIGIMQRTDSIQPQAQFVSIVPTNRNVILETFGGRDCGYCPDGDRMANEIMAGHSDRVWEVIYHMEGYSWCPTTYPNLNTNFASTIYNAFNVSGIPSGIANRSTASAQIRQNWSNLTNEQLNQPAECNIGGIVVVNPETRTATITVEVYYTGNSTYNRNYLTVAMLQNQILGSQADWGNYNPNQWQNGQYIHNNIFRDMVTPSWGDTISPTIQGTLITRTYTYEIPDTIGSPNGVDVDLDDIYFLAWVSEQHQGTPTCPILTGCKLDMVQGSDEPIFPMIKSVAQNDEISCSHEKTIKVCIQNGGTETLTSMTIETVLQDSTYYTNWEGSMIQYAKDTIEIPIEVPFGDYIVDINITEANGEPVNFHSSCEVDCVEWVNLEIEGEEEELRLELMQDKFGSQITWEFATSDGTVLGSGGPYTILASATATQLHIEYVTIPADECINFTIRDGAQNGICCSYGHGYYIVKDSQGNVLFGDESDGAFGAQASHLLSVRNGTMPPPELTQETNLAQGYNWWSTYVEQAGMDGLGMLEESLGDNGLTIRSQASGYTDYYQGYGWYGSLSSINNESSYRIITSAPCTVTMTGSAAVPSQHPITLSQGWTWIGYVPSTAMGVDEALANLNAVVGDKVKSQQGYADYYENYGWYGSLNTIEPGMGLMYYSANGETVTFTYPDNNRGGALKKNLTAENNHWKPNVHAYPDNMTVMAVVEMNDTELSSDNYELAAFANGECRGSVKLTYAEPLHRHVAFLTISGKDAAELSFKLYDTKTGMEYYDAEESFDFVANAIVGKANNLYVVHFRGTTGMDELAKSVQVYPNPVNVGERFSIGMDVDIKSSVRVEIVNALGTILSVETSDQLPATIKAPDAAGVYTLRITCEEGTCYRKMVVK